MGSSRKVARSRKQSRSHKNRTAKTRSLSIPELRKSFHQVEGFLSKNIQSGKVGSNELVSKFRKEWRKHFRRDLSAPAARSYINHMRQKMATRGGANNQIGAPLDFTTRPGVYGTHGNYLEYVNKGFQGVTPEPGTAAPYSAHILSNVSQANKATIGGRRKTRKGRKQQGGVDLLSSASSYVSGAETGAAGLLSATSGAPYAAQFRPFVGENPQTFQHSIQDAWKGLPPGASSDPSNPAFSYKMAPVIPKIPDIGVAGLDRNLLKDVVVPY